MYILELAVADMQTVYWWGRRRTPLPGFALVQRSWTAPAQSLLAREAWIGTDKQAESWLAMQEAGRYRTDHLILRPLALNSHGETSWPFEEELQEKVLRASRGVRELDVVEGNIPYEWLTADNLAGELVSFPSRWS